MGRLSAWLLSVPSNPPPGWLHALLSFIEHNLVTLPLGIVGGAVGIVYPPMFYLCGACILLGLHRSHALQGKPRVIQLVVYIVVAVIVFISFFRLNTFVQRKLNDNNTILAKLVASFVPASSKGQMQSPPKLDPTGPQVNKPASSAPQKEVHHRAQATSIERQDVLKIRSDARSLINSLYEAMTQYDSDVEHWIEMGRHGEKGPHDMISVVTKQFMDRYISDYRSDVMNTQRQLLGHIQEVPNRNPDIDRIYQMCLTLPYPNPRDIGEEIFDLRLLLNEMEREHGLPLSGTQLKFPLTIGSQ